MEKEIDGRKRNLTGKKIMAWNGMIRKMKGLGGLGMARYGIS